MIAVIAGNLGNFSNFGENYHLGSFLMAVSYITIKAVSYITMQAIFYIWKLDVIFNYLVSINIRSPISI